MSAMTYVRPEPGAAAPEDDDSELVVTAHEYLLAELIAHYAEPRLGPFYLRDSRAVHAALNNANLENVARVLHRYSPEAFEIKRKRAANPAYRPPGMDERSADVSALLRQVNSIYQGLYGPPKGVRKRVTERDAEGRIVETIETPLAVAAHA